MGTFERAVHPKPNAIPSQELVQSGVFDRESMLAVPTTKVEVGGRQAHRFRSRRCGFDAYAGSRISDIASLRREAHRRPWHEPPQSGAGSDSGQWESHPGDSLYCRCQRADEHTALGAGKGGTDRPGAGRGDHPPTGRKATHGSGGTEKPAENTARPNRNQAQGERLTPSRRRIPPINILVKLTPAPGRKIFANLSQLDAFNQLLEASDTSA